MEMDMVALFRPEAAELLENLEAALLKLEEDPTNNDGIGRVFRVIHTLKGSAGMAGFLEMVRFTHDVETIFDRVRKGTLALSQELLTLSLQTKDHLQTLLNSDPAGTPQTMEQSDQLLEKLRQVAGGNVPNDAPKPKAPREGAAMVTWWIRYHPATTSMMNNPLGLLGELNDMGKLVYIYRHGPLPALEEHQPDTVFSWWDLLLNTDTALEEIQQVFIFNDPEDHLLIHPIGKGAIRASDMQEFFTCLKNQGASEAESAILEALHAINRHHEQQRAKRKPSASSQPATPPPGEGDSSSVRVDAARLDTLVDMMGELVILQSRMTMAANQIGHSMLSQIAEDFERMTAVMRGNALALRMTPIGTSFGTLRRLVRDLTLSLGKEVTLETEGEETKLDKTVLDRLKDPLMHILRNAMDHGIESPSDRVAAGKPAHGTIKLSAATASGEVFVSIRDDGRGIHPARIRQKALEKGLIATDTELDDKALFNLLFEPGFSTAEKVTDVSGRGVGMDVVKKRIDDLRGSVEIQSQVGQGTTMTIRLPLTLAIIDGMMVRIGEETFIIPLNTVKACQERQITGHELDIDSMERMGHLIPCISLRKMLHVPGEMPDYERVIVVELDGMTVGLAVDSVIGRQQAVIKRLGKAYKNSTWISGTSINGDGSISLILDVLQLVRHAANRHS
ncbi:MAG: chemotaxis protein CheA [Magnetococcales bacterium]|nr:chemotaxis protein CheA [Magnetococcales bacterium]NGZ26338.1 chemotaxis protein CheA [Magnetococcales bacterium]